jgi:hypothetical protein
MLKFKPHTFVEHEVSKDQVCLSNSWNMTMEYVWQKKGNLQTKS